MANGDPQEKPTYTEENFQALFKGTKGDTGDAGQTGKQGKTGKIQRPAILGFIILTVGVCLGLYFTGQNASKQLKHNINTLVTASCNNERENPKSNTNKFDDLINSIIETRTATRDQAIIDRTNAQLRGDAIAAKNALNTININQAAIDRYEKNIIIPKTEKECSVPLIK